MKSYSFRSGTMRSHAHFVPLYEPMRDASELLVASNYLIAWAVAGSVTDTHKRAYAFAIYNSSVGWQGCRIDRSENKIATLRATPTGTVWLVDTASQLMRVHLKSGEVEILPKQSDVLPNLLWVEETSCLAYIGHRDKESGDVIVIGIDGKHEVLGQVDFSPIWAHTTEDGLPVLIGVNTIAILDPSCPPKTSILLEDSETINTYSPPFIIRQNQWERTLVEFTDNPLADWKQLDLKEVLTKNAMSVYSSVIWMGIVDGHYYLGIDDQPNNKFALCRFSPERPSALTTEMVLEGNVMGCAVFGSWLCLTAYISSRQDKDNGIPTNHGFFLYNLRNDQFAADFPENLLQLFDNAARMSKTDIVLPKSWSQNDESSSYQPSHT